MVHGMYVFAEKGEGAFLNSRGIFMIYLTI